MKKIDDLTFYTMLNVLQSGIWLLNDLETYLRPLNMSQARLSILLSIDNSTDGMISPKELAKTTGKSKPGITRIIDKLSEDGFISIEHSDVDGRRKKLCLTENGRELLGKIVPEYNLRIIKMSSNLSKEEKQILNKLLGKINFIEKDRTLWGAP